MRLLRRKERDCAVYTPTPFVREGSPRHKEEEAPVVAAAPAPVVSAPGAASRTCLRWTRSWRFATCTAMRCSLGLLFLLGVAACARSTVVVPAMHDAERVVAGKPTRYELSQTLHVADPRCVATRVGFELCQFRLGKNNPGYGELAQLVATDERVNLLCELPLDGTPRSAGSCSVHRHQHEEFRRKVQRDQFAFARGEQTHERKELRAELESVTTARALSQWLGQLPDACHVVDAATGECAWTVGRSTPGYAKAVLTLDAGTPFRMPGPKLRFTCRLPADGTARAAKSCRVERFGDGELNVAF